MSRSKSGNRNYASAVERAEKHSSGSQAPYLKLPQGVSLFKPKAGVMLLDILAYKVGAGNPFADKGQWYYERTFWVHRGVGANNDSFLCLAKTLKQPCPICDHRMKLRKDTTDDNEELIKELAPKERQLFNVINCKDPDKGVQVWDISHHLFGKLLDATLRSADEEDNWDTFHHLEDGQTLKVSFAEQSYAGRAYVEAERIDFRPRKEELDDEVSEQLVCLDDILVSMDYDELKEVFLQTAEEKPRKRKSKHVDEDEDEDEKPRKRGSVDEDEDDEDEKPRRSKRDEDEDEEDKPAKSKSKDDDEDEDNDEDEDEKPRKRKSKEVDDWDDFDNDDDEDEKPRKGKSKSKADDDEDDDEEDEDEDEKPRKRKSKEDDDDDEDEDEKPRKRSRFKDEDEDEDEKPRVKTKDEIDAEDEEEDEKPRRRRRE